jgi:hypothetical protein
MRTNQGIVAIIAIAFLATGCSGDKSAAAPVKEVCSLLSGDAVAKVTAKQVTSKPGPEQNAAANGGKAKSCVYSADGKDVGALAVTRYEGNTVKPAEMIAAIKAKKPGAVEVAGIGEGAVYYVDAGKAATLAGAKVVQGVPMLVSYAGPAKMTQEMMIPLVKQAVDAS